MLKSQNLENSMMAHNHVLFLLCLFKTYDTNKDKDS